MVEKQGVFLRQFLFISVILFLFWLGIRFLLLWFLPFLIALAAAYLMEPAIEHLRSHLHLKRGFISAILSLLLIGLLLAVLTILCANILQQLMRFLRSLPQLMEEVPDYFVDIQRKFERFCASCPGNIQRWLSDLFTVRAEQLRTWALTLSSKCIQGAADALANLPSIFLFATTTVLAIFFTTSAFPSIVSFLRRQLPTSRLHQAGDVKENLLLTLSRWLKAQLILLCVTFVELLLGFFILRQPYALLLTAVITLIDALPVFGTGTVLLPWAVLCLFLQHTPKAIALVAMYAVITLVRSFLEPKIMAAQANLPPIAALISMYIGFCTFGVAGMLLFPIALLLLKQLHDAGYLHLWK